MSYVNEHNQIRARFNTIWDDTLPVAWPNKAFTPIIDSPWVRLTIIDNPQYQVEIGNAAKTFRNTGLIVVQVFTTLDEGDSVALGHADTIAAIFRNWCGTSVKCRAASIFNIGNDGNGWYQVNVSIPFVRDELI
jgi:hypothetical protein